MPSDAPLEKVEPISDFAKAPRLLVLELQAATLELHDLLEELLDWTRLPTRSRRHLTASRLTGAVLAPSSFAPSSAARSAGLETGGGHAGDPDDAVALRAAGARRDV